jgi:hypothetical protein
VCEPRTWRLPSNSRPCPAPPGLSRSLFEYLQRALHDFRRDAQADHDAIADPHRQHVIFELRQPGRLQPQVERARVAGADAQVDPAGGKIVQGSGRTGGHHRMPRQRVRDPGAHDTVVVPENRAAAAIGLDRGIERLANQGLDHLRHGLKIRYRAGLQERSAGPVDPADAAPSCCFQDRVVYMMLTTRPIFPDASQGQRRLFRTA